MAFALKDSRNKDRTLLRIANALYLAFVVEISVIGGKEGIAKVMVKPL
jgi:hypothetical protein